MESGGFRFRSNRFSPKSSVWIIWRPTGAEMTATGSLQSKPRQDDRCPEANPRGFTLMEVMIAVSILSIVLLAVYRLQSQTLLMSQASRFYTTAALLAQKKLAETDLTPPEELLDGSGDFGPDYPGYSWELSVEELTAEALDKTVERLRRIDLKVSRNDGDESYKMRTYRFFSK
jgi:general secretion pathway protein I